MSISTTAFAISSTNVTENIRGDALRVKETLGKAEIFPSTEYRFVGKEAYLLKLPDRAQAIWFSPKESDWTSYAALDFKFYNPGNEEIILKLMIQSGDATEPQQLPDYISIPSGVITISRESEVAKRLMLDVPELRKSLDLQRIKGIYLETRTDNTEVFLEGFKLLTARELAEEKTATRSAAINAALTRIEKVEDAPERLRSALKKATAELHAIDEQMEEKPLAALLLKANELSTVAEAFRMKGVISGEEVSAKLLATTEKVFRDTSIASYPEAGTVRLAGNERGGFQLLLVPGNTSGAFRVEAGELKSEHGEVISADRVTLNPVAYLEVLHSFIYPGSREGWWPDPLLDNRALDLDEKVQPVWVTIHVPENQPKGVYHGRLTVKNEVGNTALEVPYTIQVRGFSLPVTAALQNLFSCVYRPEEPALRRQVYDTLLDYRINPINMYINAGTEMGYQPEREDLKYCIDRGMNAVVLWHPKNGRAEFPYDFDEAYFEEMNTFIRGYETELKALNFWEKRAVVLGFDEVTHRNKDYADRASIGALAMLKNIRKNFPGLEMANIGGPPLPFTLTGADNLWIPGPRILSSRWKSEFDRIRNEKSSRFFLYWVYTNPGYMLDMPATSPRWTSWIAWQAEAPGISYYSVIRKVDFSKAPTGINWSHEEFNSETTRQMARNGCGTLVYPSRDGRILPSIRLASVRDGIQDYEYFFQLKRLIEERSGERYADLLHVPDTELTWDSFPATIAPLLERKEKIAAAIEDLMDDPVTTNHPEQPLNP